MSFSLEEKASQLTQKALHAMINGFTLNGEAFASSESYASFILEQCNGDKTKAINRVIESHVILAGACGGVGSLATSVSASATVASFVSSGLTSFLGAGATCAAATATVGAFGVDIGLNFLLQVRMAACIFSLKGYNLEEDAIQTAVLLATLGSMSIVQDILKQVLVHSAKEVTKKMLMNVLKKIPGKLFMEINKKVGMRFITKMGQKGVVNVGSALVPALGHFVAAVVGGGADMIFMYTTAKFVDDVL